MRCASASRGGTAVHGPDFDRERLRREGTAGEQRPHRRQHALMLAVRRLRTADGIDCHAASSDGVEASHRGISRRSWSQRVSGAISGLARVLAQHFHVLRQDLDRQRCRSFGSTPVLVLAAQDRAAAAAAAARGRACRPGSAGATTVHSKRFAPSPAAASDTFSGRMNTDTGPFAVCVECKAPNDGRAQPIRRGPAFASPVRILAPPRNCAANTVRGRFHNSSGVATSTNLPSRITAIRSDIDSASPWSCVTYSVVSAAARAACATRRTSARAARRRGWTAARRATALPARRRWRAQTRRAAAGLRSIATRSDRRAPRGRPYRARPSCAPRTSGLPLHFERERDVLRRPSCAARSRRTGTPCRSGAGSGGTLMRLRGGEHRLAADIDLAGVRRLEPRNAAQNRALAASARAEQREERMALDRRTRHRRARGRARFPPGIAWSDCRHADHACIPSRRPILLKTNARRPKSTPSPS